MDIKKVKVEIAGCLGLLLKIDPLTGLPYTGARTGEKVRANAQSPFSLAETDLPTWVIFTGAASYPDPPDRSQDRLSKETRDFIAALYVCLSETGIDGEAERKVEPYLDAARQHIQQHPLFYDGQSSHIVPGILRAYLVRDDGIVQLRYGADTVTYNGLRFTIRVDGLNANVYRNE